MAAAAQLMATQRGEGQAVDRLDRLDAKAGVSAQLQHQAKRAQVAAGLWALFGIKDLELDGKAGTIIQDPGVALSENKDLTKEVKRYLGITIKKGSATILVARSLAEKSGIKLISRAGPRAQNGKQTRIYTLERDSVSLMVEDSRHYYGRLTDPGDLAALAEAEAATRQVHEGLVAGSWRTSIRR